MLCYQESFIVEYIKTAEIVLNTNTFYPWLFWIAFLSCFYYQIYSKYVCIYVYYSIIANFLPSYTSSLR